VTRPFKRSVFFPATGGRQRLLLLFLLLYTYIVRYYYYKTWGLSHTSDDHQIGRKN